MKSMKTILHAAVAGFLFAGTFAQAVQLTGTVTDKTTGKPAAGDPVILVEPMTGMTEVAHTTVDGSGHYTINRPSNAPSLVKVTHQGAEFFADAPQSGAVPDIAVYDVAPKVEGVFAEADVLEVESSNGQLHVIERYFVHNTSMPPRTQWSPKSFEIVLPEEAVIESAQGQRPSTGSLPTTLKLQPDGAKGHYAFNFPIQPDEGEKDTQFNISYTIPYSGSFTFHPQESLSTQSVGVLLPKSINFKPGAGSAFTAINQDPNIQTFVAKNATPGKALEFTISGTGSMPREDQGAAGPGGPEAAAPANGGQPGGGLGEPINTPDPLSKYKWWILGGLALLFVVAAAFLLRRPAGAAGVVAAQVPSPGVAPVAAHSYSVSSSSTSKNGALLSVLKEELFSLESEKLTGVVSPAEYAETKAALETVLKRALKNKS
jgi:hypothetical protein